MTEGAWSRFLEYASRARTKPTFDVEERQPKLEAAAKLRRALEAARDGDDWAPLLREALRSPNRDAFESPRHKLIPPRSRRWLNEWAQRDPNSLQSVLAVFLDPGLNPLERFGRFAEAAERAAAESGANDTRSGVQARAVPLTIGSLLGFSVAPESFPIVRAFFGQLQEVLGLQEPRNATLVEQYAAQLDFARIVRARMESHSIPILDMVDVQSLMLIGVREQALWAQEQPADWPAKSSRANPSGSAYLAACGIYRNEAPYLREWIEFHRLVGVERFFLYDNESTDEHLEVLAPYTDAGIVTLHEWRSSPPDQREVFDHCLDAHRDQARWIAFLDLDEFLYSPTGASVAETLRGYESWPAVGVNWAMFSHSRDQTRGHGLVIESFPLRDRAESGLIKSIVDPLRTVRCESAHWFSYEYGLAVDENQWPIAGGETKSISSERLRINHYASRSRDELRDKLARDRGWSHLRRWRMRDLNGELDLIRDDTIMQWIPALEAAVSRVER